MTTKYGELIVLGYNGASGGKGNRLLMPNNSRFQLLKRSSANGISKFRDYTVDDRAKNDLLLSKSHTVTYTLARNTSIIVEYKRDESLDMFQIGRSSEPQIDFTVVDTHLSVQDLDITADCMPTTKPSQSTISRFACRLLVRRNQPHTVRLYAAGFDSSRNIFLGEKATKWHKKNGQIDGLTTNGVLILHPEFSTSHSDNQDMYVWREASVDGDIYTLRPTRSSTVRGDRVETEDNCLKDGTLIDLCGATLIFRSTEGLANSPTRQDLEQVLDQLNAGRPVCPVNLNTLVVPKRRSDSYANPDRQPYCYSQCGHVQGHHEWGHLSDSRKHRCPMCNVESDAIIRLTMGMEPTFHLDSSALNHAFNPCGHMASEETVRYWSRIPLPHGTNQFHPVCPFCTQKLADFKPYVKLIFQDNCLYSS